MRPAEFDRQQVLVKAMNCFWKQGYQAASMAVLLEAMGISRSSFYNSFGDKRSLFQDCVALYAQSAVQLFTVIAQQHHGIDALRQFLLLTLTNEQAIPLKQGCLLVSSVSELSGVDDELRAQVMREFDAVKAAWLVELNKDQLSLDAHQAVEWVFSLLLGWRLQSQAGSSPEVLNQQINWSLDQLKKSQ